MHCIPIIKQHLVETLSQNHNLINISDYLSNISMNIPFLLHSNAPSGPVLCGLMNVYAVPHEV